MASSIFKIAIIFLAVALLALLVFGFVLWMDWPWWTGLFIIIGLAGLWIGILAARRIWLRRREQMFVQQIIAQDEAYLRSAPDDKKNQLKELQEQWKEAIRALKKSHLKRYGNPLYVLPWYMVIGESGSGKTTAIKSADLSSPFAEIKRTSGISGTRNCDWWFFEQAIILDTAGRYAIPVDSGRDMEEWQKFLSLLAKYRKKEPLNGLVVTVEASKLLTADPKSLEQDGREIRKRIDELMRALGVKFPVYLLITKCDLISGMTEFADALPEEALRQAMGVLNRDLSAKAEAFASLAMDQVSERLRDLRLMLLQKEEQGRRRTALLMFPDEFEGLREGLKAFVRGAFEENPYQETPIMRGIYFSSGRQEGTPYSHMLHGLGLIQKEEVLPGTSRGLFLHDFFGKILPADRGLFAPTARRLRWQDVTRNMGLAAWIAVGIALCGLLSFAFVKNLSTLREVSQEFSKPPTMTGELLDDLMTLEKFRNAITRVEEKNRGWFIPRFGLDESIEVEKRLKERYCKWFQDSLLKNLDQKISLTVSSFSSETPPEELAAYIPHIAARINLMDARINDLDPEEIQEMRPPGFGPALVDLKGMPAEDVEARFNRLYLAYILWTSDTDTLSARASKLRSWLTHLFAKEGIGLRWLTAWVNRYGQQEPIRLKDFWGGAGPPAEAEPMVPPAFTQAGFQEIGQLLSELEQAMEDPLVISSAKKDFDAWYPKRYAEVWKGFISRFNEGIKRLENHQDWLQTVIKMTQPKNPYSLLLVTLAKELEPVRQGANMPAWISLVYKIKALRLQAEQQGILETQGTLAKLAKKGQRLLGKDELAEGPGGELATRLKAVKAYKTYREAMRALSSIFASRVKCFNAAKLIFKESADQSPGPIVKAKAAAAELAALMGTGAPDEEFIWRMFKGPVDFCFQYLCLEAGCYLQDRWTEDVLAEAQMTGDWAAMHEALLGKDGTVWKFVKGIAAPFIARDTSRGYHARTKWGRTLPFRQEFFDFLNRSARGKTVVKSQYAVRISGLPTDTNKEAQIKPHATRIELQCADGSQVMTNLNYPITKTFIWKPESCGDVIFQIEVGDHVLTKTYTGSRAFAKFLQDFRTGQHTFYPKDFPEKRAVLKGLGIRYIRVRYRFKGSRPVLALLQGMSTRVPEKIVDCLD